MALNAYMRLQGETQGEIRGPVTQLGREDSILVLAVDHEIVTKLDEIGSLPAKRQHKPITITKEIDKSSPLLMNAFVNRERILVLELHFWQPSATGKEVQFYTIQLIDAYIVSNHFEMLNYRYPENASHKEREHIAFVYSKIIWTFEDGGVTSEDDWEAPVS